MSSPSLRALYRVSGATIVSIQPDTGLTALALDQIEIGRINGCCSIRRFDIRTGFSEARDNRLAMVIKAQWALVAYRFVFKKFLQLTVVEVS